MLQTSGKHSNKHSGGVMKGLLSDLIFSILQFQKQSSLPPVVIPHIGSFSSLYLVDGVNPDTSVKSQNIKGDVQLKIYNNNKHLKEFFVSDLSEIWYGESESQCHPPYKMRPIRGHLRSEVT